MPACANDIDGAGRRDHRAFLASVRDLGDGLDITGERGVEAICFADTRGSQAEIVQNIGRALRQKRNGATKASFAPLVAVLQGLPSHDARLVEQLASRTLTRGSRPPIRRVVIEPHPPPSRRHEVAEPVTAAKATAWNPSRRVSRWPGPRPPRGRA